TRGDRARSLADERNDAIRLDETEGARRLRLALRLPARERALELVPVEADALGAVAELVAPVDAALVAAVDRGEVVDRERGEHGPSSLLQMAVRHRESELIRGDARALVQRARQS